MLVCCVRSEVEVHTHAHTHAHTHTHTHNQSINQPIYQTRRIAYKLVDIHWIASNINALVRVAKILKCRLLHTVIGKNDATIPHLWLTKHTNSGRAAIWSRTRDGKPVSHWRCQTGPCVCLTPMCIEVVEVEFDLEATQSSSQRMIAKAKGTRTKD